MNTFQKFSEKILLEIDKRKIDHVPRWKFMVKNLLFWSAFVIALIFGALSFAIIFFVLSNGDFDLYSHLPPSRFLFFIQSIPFFWLGFLGIFLGLSILFFRVTKKGYRFSLSLVFGVVLGMSILFGALLHLNGESKDLERFLSTPFRDIYPPSEDRRKDRWMNPQEGFLAGDITQKSKNTVEIKDFLRNIWEVDISDADIIPGPETLDENRIRVIGRVEKPGKFIAEKVLPWEKPKGMGNHNGFGMFFERRPPPKETSENFPYF